MSFDVWCPPDVLSNACQAFFQTCVEVQLVWPVLKLVQLGVFASKRSDCCFCCFCGCWTQFL